MTQLELLSKTTENQDINSLINENVLLKQRITQMESKTEVYEKAMSILRHDFRNPICNIKGFTDLLLKQWIKYDFSKVEKFLNIIYQTTENVGSMLDGIIDLTNLSLGKLNINMKMLDIYALTETIIRSVRNISSIKNINILNYIPYNSNVYCDEYLTLTIIKNIIFNALIYAKRNSSIRIYTRQGIEHTELIIEDNSAVFQSQNIDKQQINEDCNIDFSIQEREADICLKICKIFAEKIGGQFWFEIKNPAITYHFTIKNR